MGVLSNIDGMPPEAGMVEVALYVFEKVLTIFPRWLARILLPPARVAEQIEIDLRRTNPIAIAFRSTEFPCVEAWFRISNQSQVNLVLDRMLVDLWVNQPMLRGADLRRVEIPRRSTKDDIHFWHDLTATQEERVRRHVDEKGNLTVPVALYVDAYFESRVGTVHVRTTLEHRGVAIS